MGLVVAIMCVSWLSKADFSEWMANTWDFSKMLIPLLFGGVFIVGFLGALDSRETNRHLGRRQQLLRAI